MKALILIGGLGTRLRPFTCGVPKPLLPVVNIPFIHYQLGMLKRHGVREVVLATAYQPGQFRRALGSGRKLGMKLSYVHERKPLGTGGAVRNAARRLGGTTVVLNGDVLQDLDLTALRRRHVKSRAEVTITLSPVKDPTRFGLVETERTGKVRRFLEKPSPDEITCDTINAGAYLFEPTAIASIPPGRPYSLERELFPRLLEQKRRFYAYVSKGYWIDFGTIENYLQIHTDILDGTAPFAPKGLSRRGALRLGKGARAAAAVHHEGPGTVVVGRGARVGAGARFIGPVCLGDGVIVGKDAVLDRCVVLDGTKIGAGARLERCVIGRNCRIEEQTVIGPGTALGDRSIVREYSQL
ncbi:MAG: NDP-sugar synthase [Elusimicrobiota bacterium]